MEPTPPIAQSIPSTVSQSSPTIPSRRRWKTALLILGIMALMALAVLGIRRIQQSFLAEVTIEAVLEAPEPMPSVAASEALGRAAPDFSLPATDGSTVRLRELRGRALVLLFYASWNETSLEELRRLNRAWGRFSGAGIEVFAIGNLESLESAKIARGRGGFSVPMLADTDGAVGESYRLGVLPAYFFIDPDGILRERVWGRLEADDILVRALKLQT